MWVNLPLFVTITIDLIKQYNEKGGSQSLDIGGGDSGYHITSSVRSEWVMIAWVTSSKRFYNGEIKHDLQVHARKVVQYPA